MMQCCCDCIMKLLGLKIFQNWYKREDIVEILFQNPTIRIPFKCSSNFISFHFKNSRAGSLPQDLILQKKINYKQTMSYWTFPSKVEKLRALPPYLSVLCFIWKPQTGVTIDVLTNL